MRSISRIAPRAFLQTELVWPSGAAVQSALLKGDRWPGQLGVGSPRVLGMRESQGVLEGRKVRPAEGGGVFIGFKASGIVSTRPAPNPALECQPAPWAPGGGPRLLPTCFSLRRLRAQAGPQGQKRGQSPAGSAKARATLNERGGRSRAAGGSRRGERQKFGAERRLRGTRWRRPRTAPQDRRGWVRTAQLRPRSQPRARAAGGPRSSSPAAGGDRRSRRPRCHLGAAFGGAQAAPIEMSPALRAPQGLHPGMPPALRPPHSSLSSATRGSAGSASAPAVRDTRAIVLDPRSCQL